MKKHIEIRKAVLGALKDTITEDVKYFDGRPGFLDTQDLPAVAVYLTDATSSEAEGTLCDFGWRATLHAEVFLKASAPDTALDTWVEQWLYPAIRDAVAVNDLVIIANPQGYDYQRDEEAMNWGSADLRFDIVYEL